MRVEPLHRLETGELHRPRALPLFVGVLLCSVQLRNPSCPLKLLWLCWLRVHRRVDWRREMVRRVLAGDASPAEAGRALMTRQLGREYDPNRL